MGIYENMHELAEAARDPQSGDAQYSNVFENKLIKQRTPMV